MCVFCLFVCLFVIFVWIILRYIQEDFWTFCKDQTWFSWDIVDLMLFICFLFVCLFVCIFYLNHLGIPPRRFFEGFVKIGLDLAEILLIYKFVYLFIYLFVCYFLFESSRDTPRKIYWKCHNNVTLFGLDIVILRAIFLVFCLNCLGIPTVGFLESFIQIGLDLAKIMLI